MYGQFCPPVTGEGVMNESVFNLLSSQISFNVSKINSSIIDSANGVGLFSFSKLIKQFKLYLMLFVKLKEADILYITPGQTFLGLLRALPAILLAKMLFCRVIAHWHGYGIYFCAQKHAKLVRSIFKFIDDNIFLTGDLLSKLDLLNAGHRNPHVVYNYVDTSSISEGIDFVDREFNVLYLGSLMEEKGLDCFLFAVESLPSISFTICGVGSDNMVNKVTDCARRNKNLTYKGLVSGEDKIKQFQNASVFVLQTHYKTEGVPLSMLEAMSNGCAVISTYHNGIPEVLADCGLYVQDQDRYDLIEKISILAKNKNMLQRYSMCAYNRSKHFAFFEFEKSLLAVFKNSVEEH